MRDAILAASMFLAIGAATASDPATRTLTFKDRVAAQKAIEQIYWDHRVWPKDNPSSKPPPSAVMSDEAIRAKLEDYLRKTDASRTGGSQPRQLPSTREAPPLAW